MQHVRTKPQATATGSGNSKYISEIFESFSLVSGTEWHHFSRHCPAQGHLGRAEHTRTHVALTQVTLMQHVAEDQRGI